MTPRRAAIGLTLILVVAFALRLAAGVWWQSRLPPDAFRFGDSVSYWSLGAAIARGEPYAYGDERYRVFRTPGYPLMLAGLHLLSRDPPVMWGRVLSAGLGTVAVGVTYWLGCRLFEPAVGMLAAAVTAIEPGCVSMGAFVLSEAALCPFMLLNLGLCAASWQVANRETAQPQAAVTKRAVGLAFAAGAAAGVASLIRPSWLLFVPVAALAGVMVAGCHGRKAVLAPIVIGTAMLAGLAVAMSPWWVRNAIVTGRFVPTSLQVGASLYDGWGPQADGGSEMSFVTGFVRAEHASRANQGRAKPDDTFEYRLDRRMRDASLAWARAHPARVAELAAIKFLRIWNIWPNEPGFSSWPLRLAVMAGYLPILVLGLCGAWRYSRRGWPYVLLWLPAVYFTLLHVVFVGSIRYRLPAMLTLAVLASAAAIDLKRSKWPVAAAGRP